MALCACVGLTNRIMSKMCGESKGSPLPHRGTNAADEMNGLIRPNVDMGMSCSLYSTLSDMVCLAHMLHFRLHRLVDSIPRITGGVSI